MFRCVGVKTNKSGGVAPLNVSFLRFSLQAVIHCKRSFMMKNLRSHNLDMQCKMSCSGRKQLTLLKQSLGGNTSGDIFTNMWYSG